MSAGASKWDDLRVRLLSAVAMVLIGGVELWLGGHWFHFFVALVIGIMLWELGRMLSRANTGTAWGLGLMGGLGTLGLSYLPSVFLVPVIGAIVGMGWLVLGRGNGRKTWVTYASLVLLSGFSLIWIRDSLGLWVLLWLVSVVIASDVAGYFAGRLIGGPKFWPRFSPKKTWSGTIAGWLGAALMGYAYAPLFKFEFGPAFGMPALVALSVVVAVAAQLGDIAESAIKRRAGVKDSSSLIPGHGGFLDRFDALISASVVVLVLGLWL